jgi:hypothetical protein
MPRNPIRASLALLIVLPLFACAKIDNTTVQRMSSDYMCRLLDPAQYVTTKTERIAMYDELNRRRAQCYPTPRDIFDDSVADRPQVFRFNG